MPTTPKPPRTRYVPPGNPDNAITPPATPDLPRYVLPTAPPQDMSRISNLYRIAPAPTRDSLRADGRPYPAYVTDALQDADDFNLHRLPEAPISDIQSLTRDMAAVIIPELHRRSGKDILHDYSVQFLPKPRSFFEADGGGEAVTDAYQTDSGSIMLRVHYLSSVAVHNPRLFRRVIAHELVHVFQTITVPNPVDGVVDAIENEMQYRQRPDEVEAFSLEQELAEFYDATSDAFGYPAYDQFNPEVIQANIRKNRTAIAGLEAIDRGKDDQSKSLAEQIKQANIRVAAMQEDISRRLEQNSTTEYTEL